MPLLLVSSGFAALAGAAESPTGSTSATSGATPPHQASAPAADEEQGARVRGATDGATSNAENAAGRPASLDQVMVVARQRSESIYDVPIAITTFSDRQIIDAGIRKPGDFIQYTPNVSLVEAQNAGTSFLTIRGLTQVRNGEAPVATVIDGVQQVSVNQFNQELYDIESIEVLKGPQGAIYGRNAIGGAINIISRSPPDDFAGSGEIGFGNGGQRRARASVGGPLGDGAVRYQVAGAYTDSDGLVENEYLDQPADPQRSVSGRLRAIADIGDDFTLDLQASSSHGRGGALNYVFQPLFGIDDPDDTSVPITANNAGGNARDLDHASLKADREFTGGTLTAILGYDHIRESYTGDQFPYTPAISEGAPFGDGTQSQFLLVRATQAEVRWTSPADDRLRWILGAYGLATDRFLSSAIGLDLGQGIIPIERAPAGPDTRNPTTIFLADDNDNDAYAVFGQLAYDITDALELALALRYDHESHDQYNASLPSFDPHAGETRRASFGKTQPKVTLTWQPQEALTLYASYGEGFRSGGFNQSGTGAAAAAVGLAGVSDLYDEEVARSAEIGVKTRLFDDRLALNGSVFRTDVSNQLYFVFVGALGAQVLTNIDDVDLRGVELDLQYQVSDDLQAFAAYGYTDSEIRSFTLEPADAGNRAPYIPQYTSSAGLQYTPSLGNGLRGLLRLSYQRLGTQYWDPGNLRSRGSLGLLDARIGIESDSGTWSAALWARNLNDVDYNSEYVLGGFAHRGQPRSYGIELRYEFW